MALMLKYFVIKPHSKSPTDPHAKASRAAMLAYADKIKSHDLELHDQLRTWVRTEALNEMDLIDASDD
jgi:hypothetical protein